MDLKVGYLIEFAPILFNEWSIQFFTTHFGVKCRSGCEKRSLSLWLP